MSPTALLFALLAPALAADEAPPVTEDVEVADEAVADDDGTAMVQTEAPPECPEGLVNVDGMPLHCCLPGQSWDTATDQCSGRPTCQDGQFAAGETCVNEPAVVPVSPKAFTMGSPGTEPGRTGTEKQFEVDLLQAYWMMRTEVTQGMYRSIMGDNPAEACAEDGIGEANPVFCVSWNDAIDFANRLSEAMELDPAYAIEAGEVVWNREANGWRLPADAEWEFAARADGPTIFAGSDNVDLVAWYTETADAPSAVAGLRPNRFQLYDMSGNVAEWVWDAFDLKTLMKTPFQADLGAFRIARGGSWEDEIAGIRVASRQKLLRSTTAPTVGLRLVRNR